MITAGKGREGVALARAESPDAVVLDLMLPDINGFAVCEEHPPVEHPRADHHADGALAGDRQDPRARRRRRRLRHQALQRERAHRPHPRDLPAGGARRPGAGGGDDRRRAGELRRRTRSRCAARPSSSRSTRWSSCGFSTSASGSPSRRDEILQKIWGLEAGPTNRTVDNFIVKLRKKIETSPDKPAHILTVYGFGYKLALA